MIDWWSVLDDAVPESNSVMLEGFSCSSAPDEAMFGGAVAEADGGCSADAARARFGTSDLVSDCGAIS
jgi:hypothetical protein